MESSHVQRFRKSQHCWGFVIAKEKGASYKQFVKCELSSQVTTISRHIGQFPKIKCRHFNDRISHSTNTTCV